MTTEELRSAAQLVVTTGMDKDWADSIDAGAVAVCKDWLAQTELRAFIAMLNRSGTGHGIRHDWDPEGTAVMVEHPDDDNDVGFWVTEWSFDAAGTLASMSHYRGEPG